MILKSIFRGASGALLLLLFYFLILTLVSGWDFAKVQFSQNWYWIVGLSSGFGVQISLFTYLKDVRAQKLSGKTVAVSGGTSGMAMIACCSHYLANIIPVLGISGIFAIIGQYQTEFFIVGAIFNVTGMAYLITKLSWRQKK